MTNELWRRMQRAARSLVEASGYTNAGTVEFLLDESSGEFFFLEVNARLQVEHPITEMITGLDLVQWQLRIAAGEGLDINPELLDGDRRVIQGHAIEARIVAEDPAEEFRPSAGELLHWAEPKMAGIRVDTGYCAGATVPRFYDSLLAKVISHGDSRALASRRLAVALSDFHVLGVSTNIEYLLDVIAHPYFAEGTYDTAFLAREFGTWKSDPSVPPELADIVMSLHTEATPSGAIEGSWDLCDGFRVMR